MASKRGELRSLTGLRFVAALHVLVFHAVFTFSRAFLHLPHGPARALIGSGYVSVGLFFVLSGFVLAYAYTGEGRGEMTATPWRFYRARFARIYPMHLVGLLAVLPLFVFGSLANHAEPGWVARESAKDFGLSALLVQAWLPAHVLDLNGPAWSLSVEAFFYLLFPMIVRALGRVSSATLAVVLVCAWGVAMWPPLFHQGPYSMERARGLDLVVLFDPLVRLPDFLVGVTAGLLFVRNGPWARAPRMAAGATIMLVVILASSEPLPFALLHDGLLDPLFALLVASLAARGSDARGLGSDSLVALGRASFALYVIHKPLYFWMARAMNVGALPPAWFLGGYVGVAIVVAVACQKLVEEPARRWLQGAPSS